MDHGHSYCPGSRSFCSVAYFNPRAEYALGGGIVLAHAPMAPVGGLGGRATRGSRNPTAAGFLGRRGHGRTRSRSALPLRRPKPGQGAIQFADSDSLGDGEAGASVSNSCVAAGSCAFFTLAIHRLKGTASREICATPCRPCTEERGQGCSPWFPSFRWLPWRIRRKEAWTRMVSFGRANDKSPTNMYGPRGISHRYATKSASGPDAKVRYSPRSYGYPRARQSRSFSLLHGPAKGPVEIKWYANDTLWKIDYLDSNARGGALRAVATRPVKSLSLEFRGASPDWYGLSMDGPTGVRVDNVAMRGSGWLEFYTHGPRPFHGVAPARTRRDS